MELLLLFQNNIRLCLIVIIILIICIFQYYTFKLGPVYIQNQKNKIELTESFTNINKPKYIKKEIQKSELIFNKNYNIQYLNHYDAFNLFNESEYLDKMNMINVNARKFNNKALCINQYMISILDVNETEKENVNHFINYMVKTLFDNKAFSFIKFLINMLNKTKLAKGTKWLEYNMPHTHSNIIIMPQSWYDDIENLSEKTLYYNGGTLIHELLHVHQRINYKPYLNIFKLWNFKQANYIDNIESVFAKNRHNPDGIDINWVWHNSKNKQYYWIGSVFNSENPINLSDVNNKAYPLANIGNHNYKYLEQFNNIKLNEFNDFINYFSIYNNNYHPNEIIAEYMETYFRTLIGQQSKLLCVGYNLFLKNINSIVNN